MRALSTKLKLSAAGLVVAVGSFFAINAVLSDADATTQRDCSSNAVITCGVMSVSEMRTKYNNDNPAGTKNIFAGMGISSNVVNNYKVQEGVVHGNGNVTIGGKVVATGATSAGREKMVGGTERTNNGTRYWERPVGLWNISSWPSYVFTDSNGKFVGAVMKNCGNPVKANPVKPPEPPAPKPVYRCASLSRIKQDDPTKYVFRGKSAAEHGAKATGFTFEFGDGQTRYVGVQRTEGIYAFADAPYTYTRSGTYNVKVTAHFTVNGKEQKVTSDDCQKPVTIKVPAPPQPSKPAITIEKKVRTNGSDNGNGDGMTREQALEQARNWRPTGPCTTVMTPAVHVETGATYTFTSGCLPPGWVRSDRSATATTASTTATAANARTATTTSNWSDHVTVPVDNEFTYRVVVKNTGDVDLKDVKVTDPAPSGVTFIRADHGTISGNAWSYTIPSLAVGKSFTVQITAKVTDYVEGRLKNTACVEAPKLDKKCDDATVDVDKPVTPAPEPEPTPEKVKVCDPATGKIIWVDETKADDYLPKDADECKDKPAPQPAPEMVKVCDTKNNVVREITREQYNAGRNRYTTDLNECKEEPVVKPVVKETVTELPQTGLAETISGIVGLGALTTASYYYLASRRNG